MTELICIVCPKGCRLNVDEDNNYLVTGYSCLRGKEYGYKELTNPTRIVTSTVKIKGSKKERLPIKTDKDISKSKIFEVIKLLDVVEVEAPIKCGDILLKNILGTNINIVATKDMEAYSK